MMKKVTVIGGGTGTFIVLSGLKEHDDLDLAAIVTMMDSGGSTGRLRDQLGVLPPGDLRQCMVALSDAPELWRKLFLYRFENGDLKGHNFGNIFLSALEKVCDDYSTVIDTASYVLNIRGKVIPITMQTSHLCVEYANGTVLEGEAVIDEDNPERSRIRRAFLHPEVPANPEALGRIAESDVIIIGPGDLYTSIVPVLLADGVRDALRNSRAKIIYNLNLMTKAGQTSGYAGSDFLADLTHYAGRAPDVIVTNNGQIPSSIRAWYADHEEIPVHNDLAAKGYQGTVIEEDVVNRVRITTEEADELTRSMLRHDTEKLTPVLLRIIHSA